MSDFDATPIDEQASDLLDLNAPAGDPAVAGRLRQFASIRAAIADVTPPAPAVREGLIAAALVEAPVSNVVSLRRRPFFAAGTGLVAAAAAAALIFVFANRGSNTQLSTSAATTASARAEVKAADSAAAGAATTAPSAAGDSAATTTAAAAGTAALPASASMFSARLQDQAFTTPQELVAAYQSARDSGPPAPAPNTSISPTCAFAGEAVATITYQDVRADLFAATDGDGHVHLTALAIEDCHRVIEVTVP